MMKNIKHIGNFSLIYLVLLLLIVTVSCKKENSSGSNGVTLLSFGPAGAHLGDTLLFYGQNLNQITAIKLVGDSIPQSGFLSQSATHIRLIIPSTARPGYVTLYYPSGKIITETRLDFLVPVKLGSWTQTARPGDTISINGTNMTWVKNVIFPAGIKDSIFISQTSNQIRLVVPQKAIQGFLTINTGGTKPLTIMTDTVFTPSLPVATAVSPIPVFPDSTLTITGTNLDLTYGIIFKGAADTVFASQFKNISRTQIKVIIPKGSEIG